MKTTTSNLLYCLGILLFTACVTPKEPDREDQGVVEITAPQFANDRMQLGQADSILFEKIIKCNGEVIPLPDGMAVVTAPVGGIIQRVHCRGGQPVIKGQLLMEIGGSEMIDIQTQFAEAAAQYRRLQVEHERVRSLYDEQVTSEKEFIQVDSEFKQSQAQYSGLKMKVEAMGLSAGKIESGALEESYRIVSPLSGQIALVGVHIGSYVNPQSELLEIVDAGRLQLRLSLFASTIGSLKSGQAVRYQTAQSDEVYGAEIRSIGVVVDAATKTVPCYALLTNPAPVNPVANEFVQAEIITASEWVAALPDEAVIQSGAGYVVLALEKQEEGRYLFQPIEVIIGRRQGGYTEIVAGLAHQQILTKGAFNIQLE
jgi:cobalt-zinc-cadmium efflux system membrane fusion protein